MEVIRLGLPEERLESQVKLERSKKARVSSRGNSTCKGPEGGARERRPLRLERWAESNGAEEDPGERGWERFPIHMQVAI